MTPLGNNVLMFTIADHSPGRRRQTDRKEPRQGRDDFHVRPCHHPVAPGWRSTGPFCLAIAIVIVAAGWGKGQHVSAPHEPQPPWEQLETEFQAKVGPLLQGYCLACHSTEEHEADVDLEQSRTLDDLRRHVTVWEKVSEQLQAGEMPPQDAAQPAADERALVQDWLNRFLHAVALSQAGDPGPVVVRRLNNAEYTWTVRDLTQVALDPAREFPVDSAAGEGFTNVGNALSMSPAMLDKYLSAAKELTRHAVLMPDGIRFLSGATRSDWTEELLGEIRAFYRQRVDMLDPGVGTDVGVVNLHRSCRIGLLGQLPWERYMSATVAERTTLQQGPDAQVAVARRLGLSPKYLHALWAHWTRIEDSPFWEPFRLRWQTAQLEDVPALVRSVTDWQRGLWVFNPISLQGRSGSRDRWMEPVSPLFTRHELRLGFPAATPDATKSGTEAEAKKDSEPPAEGGEKGDDEPIVVSLVVGDAGVHHPHDIVIWQRPRLVGADLPDLLLRDIENLQGVDPSQFGLGTDGQPIEEGALAIAAPGVLTLRIPRSIAAGREFVVTAELAPQEEHQGCVQVDLVLGTASPPKGLLPSRVTVTLSPVRALFSDERTVMFDHPILVAEGGRQRAAWESAFEIHRQLFPASVCYPQVVPSDEVLTLTQFHREDEAIQRLLLDEQEQRTLDRMWEELRFVSQEPLRYSAVLDSIIETLMGQYQEGSFDDLTLPTRKRVSDFHQAIEAAEPLHMASLISFAERAYRRPLQPHEKEDFESLYRQLLTEEMPHEDAIRLCLAKALCAAPFLFRVESAGEGDQDEPCSNWELASRLSYFLWSSCPDEELAAEAAAGTLVGSDALTRHSRRMLADPRIRRLATEFGCQWLQIYDFPTTETKSEQLFPTFTELRHDMYEESIRFLTHFFQTDCPVHDLWNADYTFVNLPLAQFYGLGENGDAGWHRVEDLRAVGRGGVLGFASILAKQSGVSRTSPILRGNWVSEVLLGERLPRPPKDVPQLGDEVPTGLTERQWIERHSQDAACAKCHRRIDPLGFALEAFDAIGRRRDHDTTGLAIDTTTKLPNGQPIDGLSDLREYLQTTRKEDITRQFCRKLLGYALGREIQLSDRPLLDKIQGALAGDEPRISAVIEEIVQSHQFRYKRGILSPHQVSP